MRILYFNNATSTTTLVFCCYNMVNNGYFLITMSRSTETTESMREMIVKSIYTGLPTNRNSSSFKKASNSCSSKCTSCGTDCRVSTGCCTGIGCRDGTGGSARWIYLSSLRFSLRLRSCALLCIDIGLGGRCAPRIMGATDFCGTGESLDGRRVARCSPSSPLALLE